MQEIIDYLQSIWDEIIQAAEDGNEQAQSVIDAANEFDPKIPLTLMILFDALIEYLS